MLRVRIEAVLEVGGRATGGTGAAVTDEQIIAVQGKDPRCMAKQ